MGEIGGIGFLIVVIIFLYIITQLRKVVATNEVHIVQSKSSSKAYGKGYSKNVYLAFPAWVPMFGVSVQKLPLSIFDLQLSGYKAYDSGKVPFQVDVTAFFVIKNPVLAAEKIYSFGELKEQLNETLKGVVRKTLASKDIIEIMESRSDIKDEFRTEVFEAVKEWGVELKNVEFMDIKDADDSQVVTNIMMKKRSQIESESQIEVAENEKNALIEKESKAAEARAKAAEAKSRADIASSDAQRDAEIKRIENQKITQNLDIEKERFLAIQKEEAKQNIFVSERMTKQKELEKIQLEKEKSAEIEKSIELIKAGEEKDKLVIEAEAIKQKRIIDSQGNKESALLDAEASKETLRLQSEGERIKVENSGIAEAKKIDFIGTAEAKNKAEMAKALNSFSSEAMNYLIKKLEVDLSEVVDLEKAKALANADVKVISTGSNGDEGIKNFMDLFSTKGGTSVGGMIEGLKNTIGEEKVNEMIAKVTKKETKKETK